MPIEATPFEQEVVAEATNDTAPETVAPLAGELTLTPVANADGIDIAKRHTISNRDFSMQQFSPMCVYLALLELLAKPLLTRERAL
jgi:hypothetical protein